MFKRSSPKNPGKRETILSSEKLFDLIKQRAYEMYRRRGNKPGDSTSDWLNAEKQVKKELGLY